MSDLFSCKEINTEKYDKIIAGPIDFLIDNSSYPITDELEAMLEKYRKTKQEVRASFTREVEKIKNQKQAELEKLSNELESYLKSKKSNL
jgi:hypothetical protein